MNGPYMLAEWSFEQFDVFSRVSVWACVALTIAYGICLYRASRSNPALLTVGFGVSVGGSIVLGLVTAGKLTELALSQGLIVRNSTLSDLMFPVYATLVLGPTYALLILGLLALLLRHRPLRGSPR